MNHKDHKATTIYYRLIAVWVICEAMLGGIIHGFRIPISGLVVGSAAVVCICLIAWYVPQRGAILKATLIVAIFKMMLSPQAPPPAYIAVFFQGLLGELLFRNKKFFTVACMLLAVLALLESGLQRILVLTIVYGNGLWQAINDFISKLTRQSNTNYSLWVGAGYVALHFIAGLLVGRFAARLPGKIEQWKREAKWLMTETNTSASDPPVRQNKKKRIRISMLIVWIVLTGLYIQSYFRIGEPILPAHISLKILLRSLIIVFAWIFIIGPLLKKLLHRWLERKKGRAQQEVKEVLELLPATQRIFNSAWKKISGTEKLNRIPLFVKIVLLNSLEIKSIRNKVYILSGPIQTGKTSSLLNWSTNRTDIHGILSPVINGKRMFMDAHSREQFQMEATENETDALIVGRFVFSKKGFDKAIQVIKEAMHKPGWLVIDEIGPIELRGEGFSSIVKELLEKRDYPILLVVRKGLEEQVRNYFKIDPKLIQDLDILDNISRSEHEEHEGFTKGTT